MFAISACFRVNYNVKAIFHKKVLIIKKKLTAKTSRINLLLQLYLTFQVPLYSGNNAHFSQFSNYC